MTVLRGELQLVLTALIGEVGDLRAVGRPSGRPFVRARGVREISRIALLDRYGDDLAAIFKSRSYAGRRQRKVTRVIGALHEARPGLPEISSDADGKLASITCSSRLEHM